jgi:peptidoglycan/LPS O-acetylase OafA/YrhL
MAPREPARVPIDALRGGAALIVLLHHVCTLFPRSLEALARDAAPVAAFARGLGRFNTEAVLLFFVLSGYCIRLAVTRTDLRTRAGRATYALRRARRILPPYWIALLVTAAIAFGVAPVSAEARSLGALLGNLAFLQTAAGVPGQWIQPYGGNGPLWSLSFEVFFYAAYPLLVMAVADGARRFAAVVAVTAAGLLWQALAPNPFAMFCGASLIWYFGVLLAELRLHGRAGPPWPALLVLWSALLAARAGEHGVTFHGLFVGCTLYLIGASALQLRTRVQPRLSGALPLVAPLAWLGAISYPLYLLHVPLLSACRALFGDGALAIGCGVSASIAAAAAIEGRFGSSFRSEPRSVPTCAAPADA